MARQEKFHRFPFAPFFARVRYAQEKSHVSHIFNDFIAANMLKSLNPPKKNEWRDLLSAQKASGTFLFPSSSSFRCHKMFYLFSRVQILLTYII